MRRPLLVAALLLTSGLASACAHQPLESASVAKLETASQPAAEPSEIDSQPDVISFDDVDDGLVDKIAAPPKRKQIPSFELFGTGETTSDPGPRLTLPPGMEQARDAETMVACYHPELRFSDPVFWGLDARRARGMWRMLCRVGLEEFLAKHGD